MNTDIKFNYTNSFSVFDRQKVFEESSESSKIINLHFHFNQMMTN